MVPTNDLSKKEDKVHYDTSGQIILGKRFGENLCEIMEKIKNN